MGLSWCTAQLAAKDRDRRRNIIEALCPIGGKVSTNITFIHKNIWIAAVGCCLDGFIALRSLSTLYCDSAHCIYFQCCSRGALQRGHVLCTHFIPFTSTMETRRYCHMHLACRRLSGTVIQTFSLGFFSQNVQQFAMPTPTVLNTYASSLGHCRLTVT